MLVCLLLKNKINLLLIKTWKFWVKLVTWSLKDIAQWARCVLYQLWIKSTIQSSVISQDILRFQSEIKEVPDIFCQTF